MNMRIAVYIRLILALGLLTSNCLAQTTESDNYSDATDYFTDTDDLSSTFDDIFITTVTTNDYSVTQGNYSATSGDYSVTSDDYSITQSNYSATQGDYSVTSEDNTITISENSGPTRVPSVTTPRVTGDSSRATTDSVTVGASSNVPVTTSASSSSTTPAPTTPPLPTTSPTPGATPREPGLENTFVNLHFSLLINATWNDTYLDTSSESYKQLSTDVRASLTPIYIESGAPGYSNIIVNSFSNSSSWSQSTYHVSAFSVSTFINDAVIARYSAVFAAEAAYTQKQAIIEALGRIQQVLMNPETLIAGYYIDVEYVNETMPADIDAVPQTIQDSQTAVCETTSSVCYSYEQCHINSSYPTGMVCIPGCYELSCNAAQQYCTYEDGTTAVCVCNPGYSAVSETNNECVFNCGDGQMQLGGNCVSAGLVIGLSVGLGLAVIVLLLVLAFSQLRTIKQLKKQQATAQRSPRYEFNDAFNNSRKSSHEAIIDIPRSADKSSKGSLNSRSSHDLTTFIEDSPATLVQYEEFKDYYPSFNGVDTETKFVLKRPQ